MSVIWLALGVLGLISSSQAATPVKIDVYYESMCPDSASFFSNQLVPTYEKLSNYMTVNLIPYGNANYRGQHDEYTFTCQHGSEECYGNMVQTCYIELVNNTESSIKFINCAFNTRIQRKSVEKCIKDSDLRRQIKKCATGSLGRNLEYEMAKKTDALQPPHNFIPWITVNGVGGTEINNKAIDNLMGVVCDKAIHIKLGHSMLASGATYSVAPPGVGGAKLHVCACVFTIFPLSYFSFLWLWEE